MSRSKIHEHSFRLQSHEDAMSGSNMALDN